MDESSVRPELNANGFRLIAVLATLAAFAPFSTDMYLAAFPALAVAFHTDAGAVQAMLSVSSSASQRASRSMGRLSTVTGASVPCRSASCCSR